MSGYKLGARVKYLPPEPGFSKKVERMKYVQDHVEAVSIAVADAADYRTRVDTGFMISNWNYSKIKNGNGYTVFNRVFYSYYWEVGFRRGGQMYGPDHVLARALSNVFGGNYRQYTNAVKMRGPKNSVTATSSEWLARVKAGHSGPWRMD